MPRLTPSGRKTALADVEDKLKAEYGDNKGAIYGTLNKVGLMHGNQATEKGRAPAKFKEHKMRRGIAYVLAFAIGTLASAAVVATPAAARCYPDTVGGKESCESINQARSAVALTKSDSADLTKFPTRALFIGDATACNIAVRMADDGATAVTLANVQSGATLPLAINRLMSTNTTCTAVTALY